MYKIYCILALWFLPLCVFAENVDISVNVPSGTYHSPLYITLTPTQSDSKTFYSFKPDGYPGDAFLCTGTILLKHSSPFIYFSIVNPTNESKIKQNDYIIEYPSTIRFEAETISGSGEVGIVLINSGSESVDMGFWYVQSESDTVIIPSSTIIAPWAKHTVYLNYSGASSVVLRSPDDDERDILVPDNTPDKNEAIPLKKKHATVKIVPRKIISIMESIPEIKTMVPENADVPVTPPTLWGVSEGEKIPDPIPSVRTETPKTSIFMPSDINKVAKASTAEAGQKNLNSLYLVALLALSIGIGALRHFMRRKQP